jgi:hypothetical protein
MPKLRAVARPPQGGLKHVPMSGLEGRQSGIPSLLHFGFVILWSFVIRHSSFVIPPAWPFHATLQAGAIA